MAREARDGQNQLSARMELEAAHEIERAEKPCARSCNPNWRGRNRDRKQCEGRQVAPRSTGLSARVVRRACGNREDQAQKDAAFKIERMPDQDRDLNQTELDSLRAMKITHHIVRDEYWDMKGGVIGNDRMEVWYPGRKVYIIQAMATLKQMDEVAEQINKSFGRLPSEKLVVVCAPDMDTFRKATGRDWWHYSLIKGDTLSFQTPMTLFMRGLLTVAARQEYSRWALNRMTNGKAPQWTVWACRPISPTSVTCCAGSARNT
jgi:hypothetical protein